MMNVNRLQRFPRLFSAIITSAPAPVLTVRPLEGGFALVEHACHLADLELDGYAFRIERLLADTNPSLPDFNGERVARERNYLAQDASQAAARFMSARDANLFRTAKLTAHDWDRAGEQEGVGRVTLRRVIEMMDEHDASHALELVGLLRELKLAVPDELLQYKRPLRETA